MTNPLDSLNLNYMQQYSLGCGSNNTSFTPADMGIGLFNMPVMPQANLNTDNLFGNNKQNQIFVPNTPMGAQQTDWGSLFASAVAMQNVYMNSMAQQLNTNFNNMSDTRKEGYSDLDTAGSCKTAEQLKEKWEAKKPNLTEGFYNKVVNIASRIGCNPDDLMTVMNAESGIDTKAVNPKGGATGLIQFQPKTAKGLGTSTDELLSMSAEEQLNYVEKHLKQAKKIAGYGADEAIDRNTLYALVFMPARAKREVLTQSGEDYFSSNPGLQTGNQITKTGLGKRLDQFSA